jgi:FkbM family methyltransferase
MKSGWLSSIIAVFCSVTVVLPTPLLAKTFRKQPKKDLQKDLESSIVTTEFTKPIQLMQGTGKRPKLYYRCNLLSESLQVAARYLPAHPVIVDVGAYNGENSCLMAKFLENGHVHAFEPVSQVFNVLAKNAKNIPNMSVYNLALGDESGYSEIFLSKEKENSAQFSMSSSLLPPKEQLVYSGSCFEGTELVKVITLDQWAVEYDIEKVDMIKLDIQGYELLALKAGMKMLSNASVVLATVDFIEAYEGQPLYQEVRDWLERQGFILVGGDFGFPKHGVQWHGNGLFVRKELILP